MKLRPLPQLSLSRYLLVAARSPSNWLATVGEFFAAGCGVLPRNETTVVTVPAEPGDVRRRARRRRRLKFVRHCH